MSSAAFYKLRHNRRASLQPTKPTTREIGQDQKENTMPADAQPDSGYSSVSSFALLQPRLAGWLWKMSSLRHWQKRFFVLTETELAYGHTEEEATSDTRKSIPIHTILSVQNQRFHVFTITTLERTISLYARDQAEVLMWTDDIKSILRSAPPDELLAEIGLTRKRASSDGSLRFSTILTKARSLASLHRTSSANLSSTLPGRTSHNNSSNQGGFLRWRSADGVSLSLSSMFGTLSRGISPTLVRSVSASSTAGLHRMSSSPSTSPASTASISSPSTQSDSLPASPLSTPSPVSVSQRKQSLSSSPTTLGSTAAKQCTRSQMLARRISVCSVAGEEPLTMEHVLEHVLDVSASRPSSPSTPHEALCSTLEDIAREVNGLDLDSPLVDEHATPVFSVNPLFVQGVLKGVSRIQEPSNPNDAVVCAKVDMLRTCLSFTQAITLLREWLHRLPHFEAQFVEVQKAAYNFRACAQLYMELAGIGEESPLHESLVDYDNANRELSQMAELHLENLCNGTTDATLAENLDLLAGFIGHIARSMKEYTHQ